MNFLCAFLVTWQLLISKHNKPRELYTANVFKRILVDYSNYSQDLKAKLAVGQLHFGQIKEQEAELRGQTLPTALQREHAF